MPEHLRALVVILVVAITVFVLARKPVLSVAMDASTYERRRNLWFGVTLSAFLAHNFWLYMLLASALILFHQRKDPHPLSVYVLLLAAVPAFDQPVPGFGLVNYFFYINHVRLLNLVILLPLAARILLASSRDVQRRRPITDFFFIPFLLYSFAVHAANEDSVTSLMRWAFYLTVDMWVPYYVFSRMLRDLRQFQDLLATLVLALTAVAMFAVAEGIRGWLLFESLRSPLGIGPPPMLLYQFRQEGGALRSLVTLGSPIALGYLLMIGLAAYCGLQSGIRPRWAAWGCGLALFAGLVAAMSRGPWVGAMAMLLVWTCTGPGVGKRLAWMIGGGGAVLVAVLLSPLGATVIDHLPFVGTVESGNVEYRQRLLEISMVVFWESPIFGSYDYLLNPLLQQMRQGQGIIDMVNTYLQIALPYGGLGLFLFVMSFLSVMGSVWRARRGVAAHDLQAERIGRALFAAIAGVLVTIGTVSSISLIPTLYWLLLGVGAAFGTYIPGAAARAGQGAPQTSNPSRVGPLSAAP